MIKRKIAAGLALAGLVVTTAYAVGLFPDYPIVGGASYCAGTSSSATGSIIGAITGCPNTVPAGPSIVTGNEIVPADTRLASSANPQTVLLTMASLNALPILVSMGNTAAANNLSATNLQGGIVLTTFLAGGMSILNVSLPPTPIDGQQFVISADHTVAAVTVAATSPATQSVTNKPTVLTVSTTGAFGYKYVWNAASSTWNRLQ